MQRTTTTWRDPLPGGGRRSAVLGSMISLIGVVALMAGCSGDGGGGRGTSDSVAATEVAVTRADTTGGESGSTDPSTSASVAEATTSVAEVTTTAAPTTTAPAPPAVVTRSSIVTEFSFAPSASGSTLLAPANGRGLLLVGDLQQQAGQRWTPTIWESADGVSWSATDSAPFSVGVSSRTFGAAWAGTTLAVGGYSLDTTGRQPAVWLAPDGRTFAAPENPFAATGFVSVVAASGPEGGVVVAGQVERGSDISGVVAVRAPAGTWTTAELGVSGVFGLEGLTTSGSDVVVTGWVSTAEGDRAAAWVSHDAGATFASADTSALVGAGDTYLSEVAAWPSGFVASACLSSPDGPVTGVVTSSDGNAWQVLPVAVVDGEGTPVRLANSGCGAISVVGSTVLVGLLEIGASVLQVDASGRGRVFAAPRGSLQISRSTPLTAAGPAGIVVVSREAYGFSAGIEADGSTAATATGLPKGHPSATNVVVAPVIGGADTAVTLYPLVHEDGNGYGFGSARSWYVSADLQTWASDPSFGGTDIDVVASNGSVDVGFAVSDDPADVGNGPAGAVAAWSRADGQAWVSHGIIAGGVGGQSINDVVAVDGGFLGVGTSRVRDQVSGAVTSSPLVLFSSDGAVWTAESPPLPAADASINEICPLPGGAQLVFGEASSDGASSPFAVVRDTGGAWRPANLSGIDAGDDFVGCASSGASTVVMFTSAGHPSILTTVDATSFTTADAAALGSAEARVAGVAAVDGRFVAAGQISDNGLTGLRIWTSADGITWAALPADGLSDVANQGFLGVATVGDRLAITGMYFDAPTVWSVPLSALAA